MSAKDVFKYAFSLDRFNFKEKSYIVGGSLIGIAVPAIGIHHLISPEANSFGKELLAWGAAIIPMTLSGIFGYLVGNYSALASKDRREMRKSIESCVSQLKETLNNPNPKELKEVIFAYQEIRDYMRENDESTKRYDKQVKKLTKNLKSMSFHKNGKNKLDLEHTIKYYHANFHNFINLIKLGKWDELSEKKKEEEIKKIKEKVEYYVVNFKNHPGYTETLPSMVKYLGNIK